MRLYYSPADVLEKVFLAEVSAQHFVLCQRDLIDEFIEIFLRSQKLYFLLKDVVYARC